MYKAMEDDVTRLEMLLKVKESMLRGIEVLCEGKPWYESAEMMKRAIYEIDIEIIELTFGYDRAQEILIGEKPKPETEEDSKIRWYKPSGEVFDFESLDSCAEHIKTVYGMSVTPRKTIRESAKTGLPWAGYGRFLNIVEQERTSKKGRS